MKSIVCTLKGHTDWDTSDLPSVPAEKVCTRCGRLEA